MNAFESIKFHEDMNDHLINPYDTADGGCTDDSATIHAIEDVDVAVHIEDIADVNDDVDLIDIIDASNDLCVEDDEEIYDGEDDIPILENDEDFINNQYIDDFGNDFDNDEEEGEEEVVMEEDEEEVMEEDEEEEAEIFEEDDEFPEAEYEEESSNESEFNPCPSEYDEFLKFDDIDAFLSTIHSRPVTTNSNIIISSDSTERGHQNMTTDENANADYQECDNTSTVDPIDSMADNNNDDDDDDDDDAAAEVVDHENDNVDVELDQIDTQNQTDFVDPVDETNGNTRNDLDVDDAKEPTINSNDSVIADDHKKIEESVNQNEKADIIDDEYKNVFETDHYRWCITTNSWIPKENASVTETITETIPTNEFYDWDPDKGEWIPKSEVSTVVPNVAATTTATSNFENGVHTYTDSDGMKFFWDTEKRAWFPQIDDDFMAVYQMNYGFVDNKSASSSATSKELSDDTLKMPPPSTIVTKTTETELTLKTKSIDDNNDIDVSKIKRKIPPEPPKWFELPPEQNTKVYVSNLPLDITEEEFVTIMSKCGMIFRDPQTNKLKVKLYTYSDTGALKGDGLCHYIKVESVDLAINILNESDVRGNTISVQRATFQMRGEYNPALKPKKKKKDAEKLKKIQEKLFDWRPEKMRGERSKHERTVIIKNLFDPELFEREVDRIIDFQNNLRDECGKCGTVRKVVIYDRHPDGVAQVNMSDPEEADVVVQMMHRRFFGDRRLLAELWDGKTKYKIDETEAEAKERLSTWSDYLEKDETEESQIVKMDKENKVAEDSDDEKYFEEN